MVYSVVRIALRIMPAIYMMMKKKVIGKKDVFRSTKRQV